MELDKWYCQKIIGVSFSAIKLNMLSTWFNLSRLAFCFSAVV